MLSFLADSEDGPFSSTLYLKHQEDSLDYQGNDRMNQ